MDIVTAEAAHGRQVQLALEAGRAVFVEKPLATEADEAEAVQALAEATGLPVSVGNISRFDARYAFLRRECEAGRFGRVVLVRRSGLSRAPGSRASAPGSTRSSSRWSTTSTSPSGTCRLPWSGSTPNPPSGAAASDVPDALVATLTAADGSLAVLQSTWLAPDAAPVNLPGPPAAPFELWGTIDGRLDLFGTAQTGRVNVLSDGLSFWSDEHQRAPDVSGCGPRCTAG